MLCSFFIMGHYLDEGLGDLVGRLPGGLGAVGFDLEADSMYRYRERICLIQVCFGDEVHLIDPLSDESLDPLLGWLKGATIWMHGADYDMALMTNEWGFVPPMLYDTQIAAQLVGERKFGYAGLVEEYFGVELSKSSQKADWGKRPLSDKMLEYAKNDVRYLLPLAEKLRERLRELGRDRWFLESCEAAKERVVQRESQRSEPWRIAGSGKLRPAGLRFLRAIWEWRDVEAEAWNRPCFMVAPNRELLQWAQDLADGKRVAFPPKFRRERRQKLEDAIARARELPEDEWPERPKRVRRQFDESFEGRLKSALEKRDRVAGDLGIDSSVIAPRGLMEQWVGDADGARDLFLPWQREVLGID